MSGRLSVVYALDCTDPSFFSSFYPAIRLGEACRSLGLEPRFFLAAEVEADVDAFRARASGGRVLLRGALSEALLGNLAASGIDCYNDPSAIRRVRDKLWLSRFLSSIGAPFPATFDSADRGKLAASLPLIAKPRRGMMGRGVALVERAEELDRLLERGGELVFQEYVAESRGRDRRAIVVGRQVLAVLRRESDGLLSNVHGGGRAFASELPGRWKAMALDLAEAAGLEYAAVDFLERGPDGFLVCEVNTVPGFEAAEKATGIDIAGAIASLGARRA